MSESMMTCDFGWRGKGWDGMEWVDGWLDGWMRVWIGWMDEWLDGGMRVLMGRRVGG